METSTKRNIYIKVLYLSAIMEEFLLDIFISRHNIAYMDLDKMLFYLCGKIAKADKTNLSWGTKTGLMNYLVKIINQSYKFPIWHFPIGNLWNDHSVEVMILSRHNFLYFCFTNISLEKLESSHISCYKGIMRDLFSFM